MDQHRLDILTDYGSDADARFKKIRVHLKEMIAHLTEITVNRCEGTWEYKNEYIDDAKTALIQLIEVSKLIG